MRRPGEPKREQLLWEMGGRRNTGCLGTQSWGSLVTQAQIRGGKKRGKREKKVMRRRNESKERQGGDTHKHKERGGERFVVCECGVSLGLQLSSG